MEIGAEKLYEIGISLDSICLRTLKVDLHIRIGELPPSWTKGTFNKPPKGPVLGLGVH